MGQKLICCSFFFIFAIWRRLQITFSHYTRTIITQDLHEEWGYDITSFIADFGGSMGFLLGISILSVLEIMEGGFISLFNFMKQRRRKDENKGNEEEEGADIGAEEEDDQN